jgi:8-oxo-dGTP diphosphatase
LTSTDKQRKTYRCCPYCGQELEVTFISGRPRLTCKPCEFIHWNNPKPATATLVPMDSGLVLIKRNVQPFVGDWCLPGGFIEDGEHPADSAVREVLEETGLEVEIDRIVGATAPGRGINVIMLFYLAKPASGTPQAGDDACAVQVFQLDELPECIPCTMHHKMIHWWFSNK